MKKTSLLLTLLMLMCIGMAKAETVTVGSNDGPESGFPTANFWKNSLSEQIYTIAEIGTSGTITDIAFYHSNDIVDTRLLEVYLVETDKDAFSSKEDCIQPTDAGLVFNGYIQFAASSWVKISITPFEYSGKNNLAIIVNDKTGSWTDNDDEKRLYFATYSTGKNQALLYCSDKNSFSATSIASTSSSASYAGTVS